LQCCAVRYNYYISHGIDTEHIASLDRSWIERVLTLLAPRLRQGRDELITCLVDEMKEDYLLSVKKAIIDFVLRDPRTDVQPSVILTISHSLDLCFDKLVHNKSGLQQVVQKIKTPATNSQQIEW